MDDRQAFEEHPKLAAAILRAANEARMPLPLWDKLLGEINAALTAARRDERRKALEEAAGWHDQRANEMTDGMLERGVDHYDYAKSEFVEADGLNGQRQAAWATHVDAARHIRSLATSDTGERNNDR